MSNAYFYANAEGDDFHAAARRIAGHLAQDRKPVNHYAVAGSALLGLAGLDKFNQGVMPRRLEREGLWGVLVGELHPCETLDRCRQEFPDAEDDLALFAGLHRSGKLAETLPTVNGAFFLMLWDPESETLVAANDRYGLYPMYWAQKGSGFCLASRIAAAVLTKTVEGAVDPLAIAQILTVDDFAGDRTLVQDVSTFPPGTVLTRTPEATKWNTYWTWTYPAETGVSVEEWGRRAGEALIEAVRRQAGADRAVGITLSGGLDSRCVAAAAVRAGVPVRSFTWGEDRCYDRVLAQQTADALGIEHLDCSYDYKALADRFEEGVAYTEGMCNAFDMHFLGHLHIIAGVDVTLNGFAGDAVLGETFLRPVWMHSMPPEELAANVFQRFNKFLGESELPQAMPAACEFDESDYPLAVFKRQFRGLAGLRTPDAVHRYLFDNHVRRKTAMGTVLMREGAESAACFFDYGFNDLIRSIPAEMRAKHRTYRAMLRTTFPDMAAIRWQTTLLPPCAPEWQVFASKVVRRLLSKVEAATGWRGPTRRQPPALFADRLRDDLKDWMNDLVTAEYPLDDALLKPEFYRCAWQRHLEGSDQHRLLGAIVPILVLSRLLQRLRSGEIEGTEPPTDVSNS